MIATQGLAKLSTSSFSDLSGAPVRLWLLVVKAINIWPKDKRIKPSVLITCCSGMEAWNASRSAVSTSYPPMTRTAGALSFWPSSKLSTV